MLFILFCLHLSIIFLCIAFYFIDKRYTLYYNTLHEKLDYIQSIVKELY